MTNQPATDSDRRAFFQAFDNVNLADVRRRKGAKWNKHDGDVLAAWVADMDFPPPPMIQNALAQLAATGDYGYPQLGDPTTVATTFAAWAERRYGWAVDPERVQLTVDVLQPIAIALELFSEPGDGVVLQTPIYPPFLKVLELSGRTLVDHPLGPAAAGYPLDIPGLRALVNDRTRIMLLCNPHNPTGRVFRRDELQALGDLAVERDLVVVSDEIHADFVYPPHQHISFSTLGPKIAARTITLTSSTKTFNIAGLRIALAVFGSAALHETYAAKPRFLWGGVSVAGAVASVAAWTEGDAWVDAQLEYLEGNRRFVTDFVAEHLPGISLATPEATYLAWLDCRDLLRTSGLRDKTAAEHFLDHGVAMNDGADFGVHGEGFVRLNFATSRQLLTAVLERLAAAVNAAA